MPGTVDLTIRANLEESYRDVYTPRALEALGALAPLNRDRRRIMTERVERRRRRFEKREPLHFLDPSTTIPGTKITPVCSSTSRTNRSPSASTSTTT